MRASGSAHASVFSIEGRRFSSVTSTRCPFTEFYRVGRDQWQAFSISGTPETASLKLLHHHDGLVVAADAVALMRDQCVAQCPHDRVGAR